MHVETLNCGASGIPLSGRAESETWRIMSKASARNVLKCGLTFSSTRYSALAEFARCVNRTCAMSYSTLSCHVRRARPRNKGGHVGISRRTGLSRHQSTSWRASRESGWHATRPTYVYQAWHDSQRAHDDWPPRVFASVEMPPISTT